MPHDTIGLISSALFASLRALPPITPASGELEAATAAFENRDYSRALTKLRIAADQGNSRAQCISGLMLLHGERLYGAEIRTDRSAALRYLEKAAAQGESTAEFMLKNVVQVREPRCVGL